MKQVWEQIGVLEHEAAPLRDACREAKEQYPDDVKIVDEFTWVLKQTCKARYKKALEEQQPLEERQLPLQEELLSRCGGVPVYTAGREVLEGLTGYALTRGVLCAMKRPSLPTVEAVCANARRVAVLEGIVDATNVGAIFRSAAALGMDAVLVTPTCCDPLSRRAARVSMGTVFQISWARVGAKAEDWPLPGLERLKALGFRTAALALRRDALTVDDPRLAREERLAVLLGTEGDGLAPQTVAQCDYTVYIPMAHGVDSLNVAAASAVAFWQLRRK